MKHTLLMALVASFSVGALSYASFAVESCNLNCKKEEARCKAKVTESGSFNYYPCLNARKKCEEKCAK